MKWVLKQQNLQMFGVKLNKYQAQVVGRGSDTQLRVAGDLYY